jgi:uncharacterized membrane protein YphA (DoxX/SURF4 family)
MQTALWILQVLLALVFLVSGGMKLLVPYETAVSKSDVLADYSAGTVKLIGLAEVLGALGVILPSVTGILPWLAPVSAVGLVLTMFGAASANIRHGHYSHIIVNVVVLVMALAVVYGRVVALPVG